jgi:hypothetical protein
VMLKLVKMHPHVYQVYLESPTMYLVQVVCIGEFIQGDDSLFHWWPNLGGAGYVSYQLLKNILVQLDHLNSEQPTP